MRITMTSKYVGPGCVRHPGATYTTPEQMTEAEARGHLSAGRAVPARAEPERATRMTPERRDKLVEGVSNIKTRTKRPRKRRK